MGKTLIAVYSQTGQSMHIAHIVQKKFQQIFMRSYRIVSTMMICGKLGMKHRKK